MWNLSLTFKQVEVGSCAPCPRGAPGTGRRGTGVDGAPPWAWQPRAALGLVVETESEEVGSPQGRLWPPGGGFSHEGNVHRDGPGVSFLFFSPSFSQRSQATRPGQGPNNAFYVGRKQRSLFHSSCQQVHNK